ncbi:MAG: hypothetical protein A2287_06715 [Candidatus Melainabacteria bacterium RIFOXYA12_FULL_32_12]|nr:MAG: hypothetical protein A2255_00230 [Candidatus Melainabacteria bacterium RIFOXYA2_FULL_32_9]OGI25421.1 MAG: hypothetical protein A2287_06715 [Candidatus Melainabacteria bacterium RIFOXYA12_FULL_32_12]
MEILFILNQSAVKKEIDNLINKRSNLLTLIIVIGGGNIGLFFNLTSVLRLSLFFTGIILFVFFLKGLLNVEEKINLLIKELKE